MPSRPGWRRRSRAGRNWFRRRRAGTDPRRPPRRPARAGRDAALGTSSRISGGLAPLAGEQDRCGSAHRFNLRRAGRGYRCRSGFPPFGGSDGRLRRRDEPSRAEQLTPPRWSPAPRPGSAPRSPASWPRRGHDLVLVARRKDRSTRWPPSCTDEHGVRAETLGCDLRKPASRGRAARPDRAARPRASTCSSTTPGSPPAAPFHESDPERELEQVRVLVEARGRPDLGVPARRWSSAAAARCSTSPPPPACSRCRTRPATRRPRPTCSRSPRRCTRSCAAQGVTVTALAPRSGVDRLLGRRRLGGRRGTERSRGGARPGWVTARAGRPRRRRGARAGSRVVVPGLPMRAAMLAARYIPHALKLPVDRVGDAPPRRPLVPAT